MHYFKGWQCRSCQGYTAIAIGEEISASVSGSTPTFQWRSAEATCDKCGVVTAINCSSLLDMPMKKMEDQASLDLVRTICNFNLNALTNLIE